MRIKEYFALCKPKVVLLMLLTSLVGMYLAPASTLPINALIWGNLGIALVAGAAAAFNHVADLHIDKIMGRTQSRPLVIGSVSQKQGLFFAGILCLTGMIVLLYFINVLTAALTFLSLFGYAICYTLYLKHATPQNIVIGGIAGAAPPLLGWTAVTGSISPEALILMLIIFLWTPPHFWSLAIYRLEDYTKANIPMLPHTHGVPYTKLNIVLYTILLFCITLFPYLIYMTGTIYLIGVLLINLLFLFFALRLYFSHERHYAIATFKYSIYYLGILFILLLIDHIWCFKR